jgi:hypothetical protein
LNATYRILFLFLIRRKPMKMYLMLLMLVLFIGAPVVLAADPEPTEPTEFTMLADDEGGSAEPTEFTLLADEEGGTAEPTE